MNSNTANQFSNKNTQNIKTEFCLVVRSSDSRNFYVAELSNAFETLVIYFTQRIRSLESAESRGDPKECYLRQRASTTKSDFIATRADRTRFLLKGTGAFSRKT